jgi:hypothetical protein
MPRSLATWSRTVLAAPATADGGEFTSGGGVSPLV